MDKVKKDQEERESDHTKMIKNVSVINHCFIYNHILLTFKRFAGKNKIKRMCATQKEDKKMITSVSEDQEDTESNSRNDKDDTYEEEVYKVDSIVAVKNLIRKIVGVPSMDQVEWYEENENM